MEKSDYKIIVGRSKNVQGPYFDKNGVALNENGGTIVAEGDRLKWYGVGHCAAYHMNDKDYLIFHGYDAKDEGRSKLIIKEIRWDKDNWPLIDNKESL